MNKIKNIRHLLLVSVWLLLGLSVYSQKQANIWYFGDKAGLDFNKYYPTPLVDGQLSSPKAAASISDDNGELMFYTDGETIWNKNHQEMNLIKLSGSRESTQGATILPHPNRSNQFLVFTTSNYLSNDPNNYGGNYYVVDFNTNPDGEIIYDYSTEHNGEGLMPTSTEKLAIVPFTEEITGGTSQKGFWIIMHEFGTWVFGVIKVDTIYHELNRIENVGGMHINGDDDSGMNLGGSGYMKVNHQGTRIAVAVEGQKFFEVFRFNKRTGSISKLITLPAGYPSGKLELKRRAYGIEFAPNGRFLYGSSIDEGQIYQWDLSKPNSEILATVHHMWSDPEVEGGAIQLAPDGNIYVALNGRDYLGKIVRPDREDAKFIEFGARLKDNSDGRGGRSTYGLPSAIPTIVNLDAFYFEDLCFGDLTHLYFINSSGLSTAPIWDIYDKNTGAKLISIPSRDREAFYKFPYPGEFEVEMISFRNGVVERVRRDITINTMPPIGWPEDTLICKGYALTLDAGYGAFYDWDIASERERYLTVNTLGTNPITGTEYPSKEFRVKVLHYNGCVAWDTLLVRRQRSPQIIEKYSTKALCGENNGTATIIPEGNIEDYVYNWEEFPDENSNHLTGLAGGWYHLFMVSNITGCYAIDSIFVGELGGASVFIQPSADSAVCRGTKVTLSVMEANIFEWLNPSGYTTKDIEVFPLETTTYEVKAISRDELGNECITYASHTIEVLPETQVNLGNDMEACEGDTIVVDGTPGFIEWNWDNGMQGQFISLTESDKELILTATDTNYCVSSDAIMITFHLLPQVGLGEDQTVCTNDGIYLTGGVGGDEYLWSTGETTPDVTLTETGKYWLTMTKFGCVNSDTVNVKINNPDSLRIDELSIVDASCYGTENGRIEIMVSGQGSDYLYSIDGGNVFYRNNVFEHLPSSDDYQIVIWEDSLCLLELEEPVVINQPDSIFERHRIHLPTCPECDDGSIEIIEILGGTPPYTVEWSNLSSSLIIDGLRPGDFSVSITDSAQCVQDFDIELDMKMAVPNAFTPNGDGYNDTWVIKILSPVYFPENQVRVFNDRGVMVFESIKGSYQAWDGKFDGKTVPMGTYYYFIFLDEAEEQLQGTLTILY